jgi:hypothetical protein
MLGLPTKVKRIKIQPHDRIFASRVATRELYDVSLASREYGGSLPITDDGREAISGPRVHVARDGTHWHR